MNQQYDFHYFQGSSLSDLFAQDITNANYAFMPNYPATARWAAYPNTKKYYIQDGSSESTKTSFDKICQKEPWKNLAVLGDAIPGIVIIPPHNLLVDYWREHFGFSYTNMQMFDCSVYLEELSQSDRFDKIITLYPFDNLRQEKHAIAPNIHYHLLSKVTLAELGVQCPKYKSYNLHTVSLEDIQLPEQFPYLIKTSHGLSGEGTYIIKSTGDFRLDYCLGVYQKCCRELLRTVLYQQNGRHHPHRYDNSTCHLRG